MSLFGYQQTDKLCLGIIFLILLVVLFFAFLEVPLTVDYIHYSTSTRAFLSGESRLYDNNTNSFYYMPWGLLVTVPLSFLPDNWGQSILSLLSIGGIYLSLILLVDKPPGWVVLLITINLYTLNLIFSGQWDGISLGASGLAWWCIKMKHPIGFGLALLMITTKPINTIIPFILLCVYVFRKWSILEILKSLSLPILILFVSFVCCGIRWPLRYIHYIKFSPPPDLYNLSLWQENTLVSLLTSLVVLVWFLLLFFREGINQKLLSMGLLVNLIISPYLLSYHFVGVSPALGWLAKRGWGYAIVPWGIMAYQVVSVAICPESASYFLYPFSIWVSSVIAFFSYLCGNKVISD